MLTENNFADLLKAMNFTANGNRYEKTFDEGVTMVADLDAKKLSYPAQIKGRDHNTSCDKSNRENMVVFECVNRLLDKGYNPDDIELEKNWSLGHTQKSGRADICVYLNGKVLFIIECKTAGAEFNHELANMRNDGGQLFSYWQQENSCQWLMLYASDFDDGKIKISAASVPSSKELYRDADTVPERFKIWRDRYDKKFFGDVIFNDETKPYQIGVPPLRKNDLKDFIEIESPVNQFEEILRHNVVSNKANAFDVLIALFICKLVDEKLTDDKGEVSFQFRDGADTYETFQDRLQKLYADGMEQFMKEPITYVPLKRVDELLWQIGKIRRNALSSAFKAEFRKLKFFNNNAFAFIDVHNEKLFYRNGKVLVEVVRILQNYFIIGSKDLQTLGKLFENLLNKGFKQDEGQFFTPIPITRFIWDSLPLDEIISDEVPKIIDYACGAGHFLTEGFQAVNACYARKNLPPPVMWERNKLFGVEKDDRLARVSKISLFMHGANEGKIKFGDGLENYPDEGISPGTFDILVANPPYSVKGFKNFLKLANDKFTVLKKISSDGSEIETLFAERISQLVKPRGVAAVILPSSILNKDGKSFVAARESLLKNFYVRAVVQLGSKTFGATGTNTVILFLQKIFDPPERSNLVMDSADIILHDAIQHVDEEEEIFAAYTKKIGVAPDVYKKFTARAVDFNKWDAPYFAAYAAKFKAANAKNIPDDEKLRRNNQNFYDAVNKIEREKISYFALTYRQQTLIISAPDDNAEQEKFLGYAWSNAKGREGLVEKKRGGLLFDNDNRAANDTLAAVIRAAYKGQQLNLPALDKYFHYSALADLLDFDAADFSKKITLSDLTTDALTTDRNFPTEKLGNLVDINAATFDPTQTPEKFFHYVDIGSVDTATNKINFSNLITGAAAPSRARRLANDGDVLISTVRPYLKGFAQVKNAPQDTLYSTGFAVLSTKNPATVMNEFIFRVFMDDPLLMEQMKAKMSKGSYPSINQGDLNGFHLLLPPLDVQKQIVDEFNALDVQLAAQDDTIAKLDADIKTKFAAFFDEKNFETRTVDELFDLQIGKTPARDNPDYWNDGVHKWISVGDLGKYDRLTGDTAEKISQAAVDATGIKLVPANTVVMSFKLTIGRTAITSEEIYTNEAVAAFISKTKYLVDTDYLRIYLQQRDWSFGQMRAVKGITLNKKTIGRAAIPLPPLELQEEFASYVKNCEAIKKSARARREELIAARAELVTKYFR